jgi:dephospho-CoA kinase
MTIIGITGTIGSGKGTVVEYLVSKYGFKHYSARKFLSEEVARRGLPDNRDSMHEVGNSLRAEFGPSFTVEKLYDQAVLNGGPGAVIESLRNVGEIMALKSKPELVQIMAVDADPKIRYERILKRKSSTDNVSFEKFIEDEQKEMKDMDPNGMNIAECMRLSDAHIENNGSLEDLHEQIDKIVTALI